MTQNETETTTEIPSIDKIQYNIDGFHADNEEFDGIEAEYADNINHDGEAFRVVLENGAWVEFRMTDEGHVTEASFVTEDHGEVSMWDSHEELNAGMKSDIEASHVEKFDDGDLENGGARAEWLSGVVAHWVDMYETDRRMSDDLGMFADDHVGEAIRRSSR